MKKQNNYNKDIKSALDSDEEHQEFLLEIQNGLSISSALEELEQYASDLKEEYIWRTSVLKHIFMY